MAASRPDIRATLAILDYALDPRMTEIPFLAMAQVSFSVPDDERASFKVAIMVSSPPSPPAHRIDPMRNLPCYNNVPAQRRQNSTPHLFVPYQRSRSRAPPGRRPPSGPVVAWRPLAVSFDLGRPMGQQCTKGLNHGSPKTCSLPICILTHDWLFSFLHSHRGIQIQAGYPPLMHRRGSVPQTPTKNIIHPIMRQRR